MKLDGSNLARLTSVWELNCVYNYSLYDNDSNKWLLTSAIPSESKKLITYNCWIVILMQQRCRHLEDRVFSSSFSLTVRRRRWPTWIWANNFAKHANSISHGPTSIFEQFEFNRHLTSLSPLLASEIYLCTIFKSYQNVTCNNGEMCTVVIMHEVYGRRKKPGGHCNVNFVLFLKVERRNKCIILLRYIQVKYNIKLFN